MNGRFVMAGASPITKQGIHRLRINPAPGLRAGLNAFLPQTAPVRVPTMTSIPSTVQRQSRHSRLEEGHAPKSVFLSAADEPSWSVEGPGEVESRSEKRFPKDDDKVLPCHAPALTAEQVCREYGARVYSVAWRMLGNEADAEDVAQEVLLQVVRKLDTFRGEASLATWLYRVTVNAALAQRRRFAKRKERQVKDPMDQFLTDGIPAAPIRPWGGAPDSQALGREMRQLIEQAIAGLPAIYRDVYALSDVEGMPNAEIGEVLTLSLPAVKSRLHRARLMMRDALAPHFEELRT